MERIKGKKITAGRKYLAICVDPAGKGAGKIVFEPKATITVKEVKKTIFARRMKEMNDNLIKETFTSILAKKDPMKCGLHELERAVQKTIDRRIKQMEIAIFAITEEEFEELRREEEQDAKKAKKKGK